MSVTPTDVAQVAQLARLKIQDTALEDVTERFGRILDLVNELHNVDTHNVEPMSNPHDMVQRLRDDIVTETDQRETLLAVAPQSEAGYFLVPKVID